ncbi:MAG: hypothetical protein ACTSX6_08230 [Candidatus Heimdallarchaeaceae archaeon]
MKEEKEGLLIDESQAPIMFSPSLMSLFLSHKKEGMFMMYLYGFYYYMARRQKTNQPWVTNPYAAKSLGWTEKLLKKTKKQLIEIGLIEIIMSSNRKTGKFKKSYILVKFVWSIENCFDEKTKNQSTDLPLGGFTHNPDLPLGGFTAGAVFDPTNALSINTNNALSIKTLCRPFSDGAGGPPEEGIDEQINSNENEIDHLKEKETNKLKMNTSNKKDGMEIGTNLIFNKKTKGSNSVDQNGGRSKKPNLKERNKKYVPLANNLSNIVKTKKNIEHTSRQIDQWAEEFRKLEELNKVERKRMVRALKWYAKNIGGEYVPEIESGKSFREKFSKLESAIERDRSSAKVVQFHSKSKIPPKEINPRLTQILVRASRAYAQESNNPNGELSEMEAIECANRIEKWHSNIPEKIFKQSLNVVFKQEARFIETLLTRFFSWLDDQTWMKDKCLNSKVLDPKGFLFRKFISHMSKESLWGSYANCI